MGLNVKQQVGADGNQNVDKEYMSIITQYSCNILLTPLTDAPITIQLWTKSIQSHLAAINNIDDVLHNIFQLSYPCINLMQDCQRNAYEVRSSLVTLLQTKPS